MTTTGVLWRDEAATDVAADPAVVWNLVSDIRLMGRWSPVCRQCEYLDGASSSAVGARFVGHNRQAGVRWSRTCVITACEPAREFAFHTLFRGEPSTRWRYQIEPHGGGARLVESYEVLALPRWVRALRLVPGMKRRSQRQAHNGMEQTLARIKAAAESGHDAR